MNDNILKSLKDLENPEALQEMIAVGKEKVMEYPLASMGLAVGLGFLLGFSGPKKTYEKMQKFSPALGDFDPMGLLVNALHSGLAQLASTGTAGREKPLAAN